MPNYSERERLLMELKRLRKEKRNETDPEKVRLLRNNIFEIEDKLREIDFGDPNIKRFNEF